MGMMIFSSIFTPRHRGLTQIRKINYLKWYCYLKNSNTFQPLCPLRGVPNFGTRNDKKTAAKGSLIK